VILLDANILVRMADRSDPRYAITRNAVFKKRSTDRLAVVPQSLYEFWAVATRSVTYNGLGMDTDRANRWTTRYRAMFDVLPEPTGLLDRWQALVATHQVKGFQAHDARYVAAMECLGLTELMTYNGKHFKDFPITVVDPASA